MEEKNSLSFLVVDEDTQSTEDIRRLLGEFVPDSTTYDTRSLQEAKAFIEQQSIDVLFLDTGMSASGSFELFDDFPARTFELICLTAHSAHGLKAIKQGASDCLLKPLDKTEFQETLSRIIRKRKVQQQQSHEDYLESNLVVNHLHGVKLLKIKDIVYLKADNTYTTLVMASGESVISSKSLGKYESILNSVHFFRIHKSFIINIHHFKEYSTGKLKNYVVLSRNCHLPVSRYRLKAFLQFIKVGAVGEQM